MRERNEDAAKQALATAMQQQQRCSDDLKRANAQVERARGAQLASASLTSTVHDLLGRQAFLERTERAVAATTQDLKQHEQVVDQRRNELTLAAREHKTLERLKERRRADHERDVARREGMALDEIAINGYRRRAA